MSAHDRVRIHYHRLPDHEEIFDQRVVLEREDVIVTLTDPLELEKPMVVQGRVALETGSRAVWFTFPGLWHDIGRFYRADGDFAGVYANILTPPTIDGRIWRTTDLFLDVWLPAGGGVALLDEDELETALSAGHIDPETAARARREADRILGLARAGDWPPAVVGEWTLARILAEGGG